LLLKAGACCGAVAAERRRLLHGAIDRQQGAQQQACRTPLLRCRSN